MTPGYEIRINQVRPFPDAIFQVIVGGNREVDKTIHTVSLRESYYEKMTDRKITPEDLIKKSFEFLLAREPKESVLREFELPVIQTYFPEYEAEIRKMLP